MIWPYLPRLFFFFLAVIVPCRACLMATEASFAFGYVCSTPGTDQIPNSHWTANVYHTCAQIDPGRRRCIG